MKFLIFSLFFSIEGAAVADLLADVTSAPAAGDDWVIPEVQRVAGIL
jgi:hypothetical protein